MSEWETLFYIIIRWLKHGNPKWTKVFIFIHFMGGNIANWQVMVSTTCASLGVWSHFSSNLWHNLDIAEVSSNDSWAWITVTWLQLLTTNYWENDMELILGKTIYHLTIGSYVSVRSSRYEARGKFGEHERCVRVALGYASSNSSFLSALQTSQVLHISMNAQLTHEPIVL